MSDVRRSRRPQAIRTGSAVALCHLLSIQILHQYEAGPFQVLGDLCRIESRYPSFTHGRCRCLNLAKRSRVGIRIELAFVNVCEDQFASRSSARSDCAQGCKIRLACEVHRYTEPGEEGRMIRPKGRPSQCCSEFFLSKVSFDLYWIAISPAYGALQDGRFHRHLLLEQRRDGEVRNCRNLRR